LRLQLLDQGKVEEGLEAQKDAYTKKGAVKSLAQVLQEKKLLTSAQVDEVKHAIDARDKKKSGSSAVRPGIGAKSGSTPVIAKGGKKGAAKPSDPGLDVASEDPDHISDV